MTEKKTKKYLAEVKGEGPRYLVNYLYENEEYSSPLVDHRVKFEAACKNKIGTSMNVTVTNVEGIQPTKEIEVSEEDVENHDSVGQGRAGGWR